MSLPAAHNHISERESAHTWPDGQKDNSAWEDCTWDAGLEFYRLAYDATRPATHAEAERLRAASGEDPIGGTSVADFQRGVKARYGRTLPPAIIGWNALRSALKPNYVALVQGSMKAFGASHRLSRWDKSFDGGHAVCVIRLADGTYWWCDPLATDNGYLGEKVSESELKAYVTTFSGAHIVAPIKDVAPALPGLPGLDVSIHQAKTPNLTGQKFLIARASNGLVADGMFPKHIAAANAAGLVTGAYHFNSASGTPEEQADFFLDQAGDVDLLFLDVEGADAFTREQARAFIDRVHSHGKRIGLYMSESVFRDDGQDYDWVAKWSTSKPKSWDFWQHTSSGTLAGYTGRLDLDRFNGTEDQLRALSNKEPTVVANLTSYLPGYTATIKPKSNVRTEPHIKATKLRMTTANEPAVVVGTVKGDVDPANGSDVWYELFKDGRSEYTATDNIVGLSAPVAQADCSGIEKELAAKVAIVNSQAATIADLKSQLAIAKPLAEKATAAIAALKTLLG